MCVLFLVDYDPRGEQLSWINVGFSTKSGLLHLVRAYWTPQTQASPLFAFLTPADPILPDPPPSWLMLTLLTLHTQPLLAYASNIRYNLGPN